MDCECTVDLIETRSNSNAEANLSTEKAEAHAHTRFPRQDGDSGWPQRPEAASLEGTTQAHSGKLGGKQTYQLERVGAATAPSSITTQLREASRRYRWSKEMRLRRPGDFRRVWAEGRAWAHPLFIVRGRPNGSERTRIGITASRKIGGSVQRNRARRLLREAARKLYADIVPGWDLVLIARRGLLEVGEPEVTIALRNVLRQAELCASTDPAAELEMMT